MEAGLSWEALLVAAALPLLRVMWAFRERGALLRDAESGLVVVIHAPTEDGHELTIEQLPHSGWAWTAQGIPAPWRQGAPRLMVALDCTARPIHGRRPTERSGSRCRDGLRL